MGLRKLAAKVGEYRARLESGKASRIEPSHVEKTLRKLRKKTVELEAEIASAASPEKKDRLKRKLGIARAHVERAEWLLREIS